MFLNKGCEETFGPPRAYIWGKKVWRPKKAFLRGPLKGIMRGERSIYKRRHLGESHYGGEGILGGV